MERSSACGGAYSRPTSRNAKGSIALFEAIRGIERIIGAEPGGLFGELSEEARGECWADLRDRQDRRNSFLAYGDPPKRPPALRQRACSDAGASEGRDNDPLRAVPLPVAFEILTGEAVPASGLVRCPLPDHEDRTPSCHVAEHVFFCHGCLRGGSAIDLAAHIYGLEPRGAQFFEIRRRVALELLGREAA